MKAVIVIIVICILLALIYSIISYAINFIDMLHSRACVIQTIDQIIKMIRYQQIILSEFGIPYKTQLNRTNFSKMIVPLYFGIIDAYWDLPKKKSRLSPEHYRSLEASYTDNINALNILLEDYNVYNIRYRYSKDKCYFIENLYDDFPFLDDSIKYHMDNGILGTGSFQH